MGDSGKQGCCHGWAAGPQGELRGSQHEFPWSFEDVSLVHALLSRPMFPHGAGPLLPHQSPLLHHSASREKLVVISSADAAPSLMLDRETDNLLSHRLPVERCGFWAGRGIEWGLEPSGPPTCPAPHFSKVKLGSKRNGCLKVSPQFGDFFLSSSHLSTSLLSPFYPHSLLSCPQSHGGPCIIVFTSCWESADLGSTPLPTPPATSSGKHL